ncbi:MAG: heparan-alpha-glucosaminide N-acetyltransferase [Oscillospiraceae bacterium]
MKSKYFGNRVHLIDEVRGFAIICMVVYHMAYDLVVIFGMNIPLFYTDFTDTLVVLFAGLFIFISGSACLFSRNNLKRGFFCFMLGMAMTIFTFFFMSDSLDIFGILHMLGINMMLFPLLAPFVKKISPVWGIVGCLVLWLFTYNLQSGYLGFEGIFTIDMPNVIYKTNFLFPIGLSNAAFFSVDYFPLIPWTFCFFAGSFLGVLLKERRLPEAFYKMHFKPLAFVGRNTLLIYILHQPIIFSILWVIFRVVG